MKRFCQLCALWRGWKLECIIYGLVRQRMPFSSRLIRAAFCSRSRNPQTKLSTRSQSRQKRCWCVPYRTVRAASCAAAETDHLHVLPVYFITCSGFYLLMITVSFCRILFVVCNCLCISFGVDMSVFITCIIACAVCPKKVSPLNPNQ